MISKMPPGATPGPTFVSEDPTDKTCQICTHYLSEHLEGGPCTHLMFTFPLDANEKKYAQAGFNVIQARQLCDCKEFQE